MPRSRRAPPLPADERRSAIIEAVVPLLVRNGATVTTRELAAAAGVAEGTLFAVFDDKRALILGAIEQRLDPGPIADAVAAVDPTLTLPARLAAAADAVLPCIDQVRAMAIALHGLPTPPRAWHRPRPRHLEAWTDAVRGAVAALLAPDADRLRWPPERLAELFVALLFANRAPWAPPLGPFTSAELVEVLLYGAAADPTRGDPPPC